MPLWLRWTPNYDRPEIVSTEPGQFAAWRQHGVGWSSYKQVPVKRIRSERPTRYAPSPLVGEGWGGGWRVWQHWRLYRTTPTPNPSPPQVGPARLTQHGAEPGQARV